VRIAYKLNFFDYVLFCFVHQFSSIIAQILFLGLGLMVFLGELVKQGASRAMLAGIGAYFFVWIFQLIWNMFILYSSKNKSLLTDHVVEIQDNFFFEESPFGMSYQKWMGIAKVISRPGFVAVYINGQCAHIIPSRAFSNSIERQKFLDQIRVKLTSVKSKAKK
jgi:hypothetical protein